MNCVYEHDIVLFIIYQYILTMQLLHTAKVCAISHVNMVTRYVSLLKFQVCTRHFYYQNRVLCPQPFRLPYIIFIDCSPPVLVSLVVHQQYIKNKVQHVQKQRQLTYTFSKMVCCVTGSQLSEVGKVVICYNRISDIFCIRLIPFILSFELLTSPLLLRLHWFTNNNVNVKQLTI